MKQNHIFYVSYYNKPGSQYSRASCLAAVNLIDSICNLINAKGVKVTVLSPSYPAIGSNENTRGQLREELNDNTDILYTPMLKPKIKAISRMNVILSHIWLFFYLIIHCDKDTSVIMYHAPDLSRPVKLAHRLRHFKLILQIAEIYADVTGVENQQEQEYAFFREADDYIFSSDLLRETINTDKKPCTVIYGTYSYDNMNKRLFKDDRVHVVYAGTFDPRKGGAAAVDAVEFLTENYHVHILGFGSTEEINNINNQIVAVASRSKCLVTYEGLLSGKEYIQFIQSCDIGLSTQNPDASFNATSFPSKILSYMSNGLRVVSIRIPAIEKSTVGKWMYYYDKQTPHDIAEAIMSVNLNDEYNGKNIIKELAISFQKEIIEIIGN